MVNADNAPERATILTDLRDNLRHMWRLIVLGATGRAPRVQCGAELFEPNRSGARMIARCERPAAHFGRHRGNGKEWRNR